MTGLRLRLGVAKTDVTDLTFGAGNDGQGQQRDDEHAEDSEGLQSVTGPDQRVAPERAQVPTQSLSKHCDAHYYVPTWGSSISRKHCFTEWQEFGPVASSAG